MKNREPRTCEIKRETNETKIALTLTLDGKGQSKIDTGCGFFDHMLTLLSRHGRFDLDVKCEGDTNVDFHHTVEDVGIVLGRAFSSCLGDCRGICRYGDAVIPMDEALVLTAVDVSGRGYLGYDVEVPAQKVGDFDTELAEEFFAAFAREAKITMHIRKLAGKNSHHIIECAFKSAARALREAVSIDGGAEGEVPSTKGALL